MNTYIKILKKKKKREKREWEEASGWVSGAGGDTEGGELVREPETESQVPTFSLGVCWIFKTHFLPLASSQEAERFELFSILFFCRSEPVPRPDRVGAWVYIGYISKPVLLCSEGVKIMSVFQLPSCQLLEFLF